MKLTDEQLSRVLTAHARGGLTPRGNNGELYPEHKVCLFQAAHDYTDSDEPRFDDNVMWFDDYYQPDWTVDMFLCQLQIRGLA